ncbi:hypothetical protein Taro_053788 [Colocasia esculenta]|uniref:Uncharacterized protein n=1 Tax=Colocasia esculenta TaxID=4460 RepID=A0A843XM47_COLES|nr:hypothetical protein [Colocasia esculenta]
MILSLENVSQITGLRVYGRAVSGYTYPCYHSLAERLLDLPVECRPSLMPRVALQESLGLYKAGKNVGESEDEYLARLARVSRRELASETGPQADLDLRRFLVLFLGRLLFATRGDAVHCRFLLLLEDLGDVWAYLHLPSLGRGDLTRSGLVPIERRWDSRRDTRHLVDQLERLQEAIDSYPYLDVVWQPYLGEGDQGQPWLAQARPYFSRSVWLHALNLVLPLNLFLTQCSLGFRQSVMEFPVRDRFRRPGRSFRGLHDTTDWQERAHEQIENWEHKGKAVDVTGEIASLRALLQSAVQDGEAAQRQTVELRSELERVRGTGAGGASSSRSAGGSPSLMEARLAGAVLRAEEAQRHLEERALVHTGIRRRDPVSHEGTLTGDPPPVDVAIAPPGVNNDVPAPVAAAPATAHEVAELRGQMQQLTGVCLALQAQLARPPAPAVPLSRERQAESSHRRSRILPAPQEQQADSLRRSHRTPSEE